MQFNITTDYAVRFVLFLAAEGQAGAAEISRGMGIPRGQFGDISRLLRRGGIIAAKRGLNGGYYLTKKPEEITLREIITLAEPTTRINRCLEEEKFCSRHAVEHCTVRRFYTQVQAYFDEAFGEKTIASLLKDAEDEKRKEF